MDLKNSGTLEGYRQQFGRVCGPVAQAQRELTRDGRVYDPTLLSQVAQPTSYSEVRRRQARNLSHQGQAPRQSYTKPIGPIAPIVVTAPTRLIPSKEERREIRRQAWEAMQTASKLESGELVMGPTGPIKAYVHDPSGSWDGGRHGYRTANPLRLVTEELADPKVRKQAQDRARREKQALKK